MDTAPTTSGAESLSADRQESKKYIRTFAGDMEILKKGGSPDLALLKEQQSPPSPQPSLLRPTPLQTYGGDFAERMKETNASTATVLAAEQDSALRTPKVPPQEFRRNNFLYSITGGVLLIAGGVGAYFVYTRYLATAEPVILIPSVSAPIFVEERVPIFGTGKTLRQSIEQLAGRSLTAGTVRLLYLEGATTTSVFSALQEPAPNILLRSIRAEKSMAGVVSAGGVQSVFFILSVSSYSDTFAGMLQWEPTIPRDLDHFFPPYPAATSGTATTSTTTSHSTAQTSPAYASSLQATQPSIPTVAPAFRDEVIANHDARVYRDATGREVLLYGYWNQTTLVIARDTAAFVEVLRRLATSRAQ